MAAEGIALLAPAEGAAVRGRERSARTTRIDGVRRDSLVLMAGTVTAGFANYVFVLSLAWILPSRQFSELASINTIVLVLSTAATAAFPWVVAQAVVRHGEDSSGVRQVLNVTAGAALAAGVAGGLLVMALSSSYASVGAMSVAALTVVLVFVSQVGNGYLQGRRVFASLAALTVLEAVLKVGLGSVLAFRAGATGALTGGVIGVGVLVGISLWIARRDLGRSRRSLRTYPWAQVGGIAAVQLGVSALAMLDVIVGSFVHGASRTMAGYQAMLVFARVPLFLTGAISAALYPRLVGVVNEEDRHRVIGQAAAGYAVLVPAIVGCVSTLPGAVLFTLLPGRYRDSLSLLTPLAIAGAAAGWINLITTAYQAECRFRLPVRLIWTSIALALPLEFLVAGSVDRLAWTAAACNSAVAIGLTAAAGRRYRGARIRATVWRSAAVTAVVILILRAAKPVPAVWCLLAVAAVAASIRSAGAAHFVDGEDQGQPITKGPSPIARVGRRIALRLATRVIALLRPVAPPAAWDLLLTARSIAGHWPVMCAPSARRALVVAPHPDDETIGCGGTIAVMAAAGATVDLVVASRGEASVAQPGLGAAQTARQRMAAATAAAQELGAAVPVFLDGADGQLSECFETLVSGLVETLQTSQPEIVFAPWPLDNHPDHQAVAAAVAAALARAGVSDCTEVWAYEVWAALPPNRLVDVTRVWGHKVAALRHHHPASMSFDLDAHLALSRWRSILSMNGYGYAEAFLVLPARRFCDLVARGPVAGGRR